MALCSLGAGLDDGGDHDLDESAAERVEENRRQNREIRVRHAGGEQAQRQQSGKGGQVGGDNARLVSDAVHELAGQHVHDQLGDEVDGDEAESRAMSMPSVAANVTNSNGMKLLITA